MLQPSDRLGFPHRREIVTYVIAVVPFLLNLTVIKRFNGQVTSYTDFADMALGVLLIVLVIGNRDFIAQGEKRFRIARIAISVVLLVLGLFHLVSGIGLLAGLPWPIGFH